MATEKLFRSKVVPLCAMPNSYKVPEKEKRNCQSHRRKMCAGRQELGSLMPEAAAAPSSSGCPTGCFCRLESGHSHLTQRIKPQPISFVPLWDWPRVLKLEALMASALVTRSDKCPMARLGEWLRLLILFCFVFCITADIKLGPTC